MMNAPHHLPDPHVNGNEKSTMHTNGSSDDREAHTTIARPTFMSELPDDADPDGGVFDPGAHSEETTETTMTQFSPRNSLIKAATIFEILQRRNPALQVDPFMAGMAASILHYCTVEEESTDSPIIVVSPNVAAAISRAAVDLSSAAASELKRIIWPPDTMWLPLVSPSGELYRYGSGRPSASDAGGRILALARLLLRRMRIESGVFVMKAADIQSPAVVALIALNQWLFRAILENNVIEWHRAFMRAELEQTACKISRMAEESDKTELLATLNRLRRVFGAQEITLPATYEQMIDLSVTPEAEGLQR